MEQSHGTGHSEDIQIFLLAHLLFFLYEPSGSPGIGFLIFAEEQGTYQRPSEYQAWIYPTSRFRSPEEELFRFHIKHKGMDGRLLLPSASNVEISHQYQPALSSCLQHGMKHRPMPCLSAGGSLQPVNTILWISASPF